MAGFQMSSEGGALRKKNFPPSREALNNDYSEQGITQTDVCLIIAGSSAMLEIVCSTGVATKLYDRSPRKGGPFLAI
jgi:hypothetical protein